MKIILEAPLAKIAGASDTSNKIKELLEGNKGNFEEIKKLKFSIFKSYYSKLVEKGKLGTDIAISGKPFYDIFDPNSMGKTAGDANNRFKLYNENFSNIAGFPIESQLYKIDIKKSTKSKLTIDPIFNLLPPLSVSATTSPLNNNQPWPLFALVDQQNPLGLKFDSDGITFQNIKIPVNIQLENGLINRDITVGELIDVATKFFPEFEKKIIENLPAGAAATAAPGPKPVDAPNITVTTTPAPARTQTIDDCDTDPDREEYDIYKPPASPFIKVLQGQLARFYKLNNSTKELAVEIENIDKGKLEDSKYGHRTHFMAIKSIEALIEELNKIKSASNGPVAESRVDKLQKLLNKKLLNLREDATQTSQVDDLISKLKKLQEQFTKVYDNTKNWQIAPDTESPIGKDPLQLLLRILCRLKFDDKGVPQDLVATLGGKSKQQPAKPAAPAAAPVKQIPTMQDINCWFRWELTIQGNPAATPVAIFQNAGIPLDDWYKRAMELMTDTEVNPTYSYISGILSNYKKQVEVFYDNRIKTMNLSCFIQTFGLIRDNFLTQLGTVQQAINNKTSDSTDPKWKNSVKYFLDKAQTTTEGSYVEKLFKDLDVVLAGARNFRDQLINVAREASKGGESKAAAAAAAAAGIKSPPAAATSASKPNETTLQDIIQATCPGGQEDEGEQMMFTTVFRCPNSNIKFGLRGKKWIYSQDNFQNRFFATMEQNGKLTPTSDRDGPPSVTENKNRFDKRNQLIYESLFKKLVK